MKKNIKHFLFTLIILRIISSNLFIFAAVHQIPELSTVVSNITDTLVWIIATLLVLFIIGFGIQFIIISDQPQERSRIKTKLIWTIVGLFIILSANPISSWLQSIL